MRVHVYVLVDAIGRHGCCSSGASHPLFWDRLLLTWSLPQKPDWRAVSPRDWLSPPAQSGHQACTTTLSCINVGSAESNLGLYPWVISLASVYLKTCLDVTTSSRVVCHCTLCLPTACVLLPALAGPLPPQYCPFCSFVTESTKIGLLVCFSMLIKGPAMSPSV